MKIKQWVKSKEIKCYTEGVYTVILTFHSNWSDLHIAEYEDIAVGHLFLSFYQLSSDVIPVLDFI